MPPAARMGDPTGHPGVLTGPGAATVLIGGQPAALVGMTMHACSFPPPAVHPPSPIVGPGVPTVLIGGMPASVMGDLTGCGAPIIMGCMTVMIGG